MLLQGEVLRSEIDGCIQMKSFITGTPEVRIGLNEDLTVGRNDALSSGTFTRLAHKPKVQTSCMCTHTCTHTHTHAHTRTCTHTHTLSRTHAHTHTERKTNTHTHTHTHTQAQTHKQTKTHIFLPPIHTCT